MNSLNEGGVAVGSLAVWIDAVTANKSKEKPAYLRDLILPSISGPQETGL